jgi:hypothetical protein
MSHISKIELLINDLQCLKMACERMGLQFRENQKTYNWYGKWASNEPIPQGLTPGKCNHAIHVPNASYEVGVIKQDGENYSLHADMWPGGGLAPIIGENAALLKQAYAIERVKKDARQKRMRIHEVPTETGIRLTLSR